MKNNDLEGTNNIMKMTSSETAIILHKKQFSAELELFSFPPIIYELGEMYYTLKLVLP